MTGKHPYTPAEILDMGRRSEFEGNLDYATQFYSYLIEGLPGTREAAEARIGMDRVSQLRDRAANSPGIPPLQQNASPRADAGPPPPTPPKAQNDVPRTGPSSTRLTLDASVRSGSAPQTAPPQQVQQQRTEPSLATPTARLSNAAADRPPQLHPTTANAPPSQQRAAPPQPAHLHPVGVHEAQPEDRTPLPRVVRGDDESDDEMDFVPGYRIGRFLAYALVLLGWMAIIGGLVFGGITVAGVAGTQPIAEYGALPLGILVGAAALTVGLLMVFLGSLAQAAFEAANNTRELLEIERAKAGW